MKFNAVVLYAVVTASFFLTVDATSFWDKFKKPKKIKVEKETVDGCDVVYDEVWEEKCHTVYNDVCTPQLETVCSTVDTRECSWVPEQECSFVLKDKCTTLYLPKCDMKWEEVCHLEDSCHTVDEKVCSNEPKEICVTRHAPIVAKTEAVFYEEAPKKSYETEKVIVIKKDHHKLNDIVGRLEDVRDRVAKGSKKHKRHADKKSPFDYFFKKDKKSDASYVDVEKDCHTVEEEVCRSVPKEVCEQVENCRSLPRSNCVKVPERKCVKLPTRECAEVNREKCVNVPQEECQEVEKQVCHSEPAKSCTKVTVSRPREVCLPPATVQKTAAW